MSSYGDDDDLFASDDSDILGSNKGRSPKYRMRGDQPFKEILEEFVNKNPDAMASMYTHSGVGFQVPMSVRFFKDISQIFSSRFGSTGAGAYDRAVIEILDEMTGGQVSKRARMFESERFVTNVHDGIQTANQIYVLLTSSERAPTETSEAFLGQLVAYLKIMMYMRDRMINEYYEICADAGVAPSETVVNFGIIEHADAAYMASIRSPVYNTHYSLGDVSQVRVLFHKQYDHLCRALIDLIYTGDPIAVAEPIVENENA